MAASRRQNWHDGPEIPNQFSGEETLPEYPGQFLGMPKEGTGSQASVLRRMGGVFIDWALCAVAASLITANTSALGDRYTVTYLLWIVLGLSLIHI